MWLFLLSAAFAATPVRLPPGESPAAWAGPLGLADLAPGTPGDGAWVELVPGTGTWTLRVRDARGAVREASVKPPQNEQDREDIAWLAASLLRPAVSAPPVPVPPVTPPAPPVRPLPTPQPEVAIVPEPPVEPEPLPVQPEAPPVTPSRRAGFDVRALLGIDARTGVAPAPTGWADLRVVLGPFRPGIGAGFSLPSRVSTLEDDAVDHSASEAWLGVWYLVAEPVPFGFGVSAGAAVRSFREGDDALTDPIVTPVLGSSLALSLPIGAGLHLEPDLGLRVDTRMLDLVSRSEGRQRFGDWCVRAGFGVRFEPERENE